MTHLKVDVATFLSYRQNNRERIYFDYFHHLFFSYFNIVRNTCEKNIKKLKKIIKIQRFTCIE